ncbi:MAG: cysteate synthase [Actinomycetota bacterium]|nr:cysteate synthase [Actinomycetota bacterium]
MRFTHYGLRCQGCGETFEDDGFVLDCPIQHDEPALLTAEYKDKRFEPDACAEGMFRYRRWLPGARVLPGAGSSVTYKSEKLNRVTGLSNVWVVFNGYWPEKGATLETATFKELEAWSVLSRTPEQHEEVLVVASAGNTAAAFARACSLNEISCLLVVPEAGLPTLRFSDGLDPRVKVVSLAGFTDYYDAITLANRVSQIDGFFAEGGVKNIAKREGLGTTVLNAVEKIGEIPRYYFQAIGSGSGGIAVYDAAKRLTDDGRFGDEPPRLMLSQNLPYVPIYTSWKTRRRELVEIDDDTGKKQIQQIAAHVLSNRRPAYSVRGGIFDALTETQGNVLTADNSEMFHAKKLFEESEGIDIDPAGAVAFATLLKAARYDALEKEALVLLNITGGGRQRQQLDKELVGPRPALQLNENEILLDETLEKIIDLFS